MKQPDPKMHQHISFVKSAIRIVAGVFLMFPQGLIMAGSAIIIAEILGIIEELV